MSPKVSTVVYFLPPITYPSLTPFVHLTLQGNGATGGCCSKCWREMQKKNEAPACTPAPVVHAAPAVTKPIAPFVVEEPTPMEVDTPPAVTETVEEKHASTTTPKKKKKKASYKNMMKGMMQSNSPTKDIEKEKEPLRKVTGGGEFSKIDKI
jgi:hypothetical protein